jgi:hydrogenase maturation protease
VTNAEDDMTQHAAKILVLAYGNPGRRDDGLGPALAAALEEMSLPGVTVESDYQLTVEDAAAVAAHDVVVFADADAIGPEPFSFARIEASDASTFSTHSISPGGVLALAQDLFGARTEGYLLGVRGYEFNEFGESLSPAARENLARALEFLTDTLRTHSFREVAAEPGTPATVAAASKGEL